MILMERASYKHSSFFGTIYAAIIQSEKGGIMNKKGFTLIELLIVVAIIGIVAAIAIPNLLTALQKGKMKATMADMKTIGGAIESYLTDNYMAPGSGAITSVFDLQPYLEPFYIRVTPTRDGWGTSFVYESGQAATPTQEEYSIISYGRGGTFDGMDVDQTQYLVNAMNLFELDYCFANGSFTYAPKTK